MPSCGQTSDPRSPIPPDPGEVLVRVENVSKKFCRSLKRSLWYGVRDIAAEVLPFGRKKRAPTSDLRPPPPALCPPSSDPSLRPGEFCAVRDVSLELKRGECIGLIGHNGAGKTTLLKMLNGLIKPDSGRIEMRGRVGALIALGAGFNPILTGRENIFVNGSVLGLAQAEIEARLEEIIEFAEIGEFIDTPVQNYSSGMQVRLGFAIATALKPDVLLLDEVLAVGDMAFQTKCYNRLGELRRRGVAFILVSHNLHQIMRFTTRVIHLDHGQIAYDGPVAEGIAHFHNTFVSRLAAGAETNRSASASGDGTVQLREMYFADADGRPISVARVGESIHLVMNYRITGGSSVHPMIDLTLRLPTGEAFLHVSTEQDDLDLGPLAGEGTLSVELKSLPANNTVLTPGVAIWNREMTKLHLWQKGKPLEVKGEPLSTALAHVETRWHHQPGPAQTN